MKRNLTTRNLSGTTVPNPGINPGIPGLAFLNPEIPGLESGPGIAIPNHTGPHRTRTGPEMTDYYTSRIERRKMS